MQAMVHCKDSLNWTWLDDDGAVGPDAFSRFCAIARDDKARLMAWAVARLIKQQVGTAPHSREYELAGNRAAVDVRDYWTPAAGNYWGRTTKGHMLEVLDELTLGQARGYSTLRKDALVALLDRLFNRSEDAISVSAKAAAKHWLPPGMAFAAPADIAPADAGDRAVEDAA